MRINNSSWIHSHPRTLLLLPAGIDAELGQTLCTGILDLSGAIAFALVSQHEAA
jgi:hypothetical protein